MQAFAHSLSNGASNGAGLLPVGFGEAPPSSAEASQAPLSGEPTGFGKEPTGFGKEPTGLGQIQLLTQRPKGACRHWLLAYVEGGRPIVAVAGSGFSYQQALAQIGSGKMFVFTGSGGSFLFATDVVSGRRCLKVCVDGLNVSQGGAAKYTVSNGRTGMGEVPGVGVGANPVGVGESPVGVGEAAGTGLQYPTTPYTPFYLRPIGTDPTNSAFSAFTQVYPNDQSGVVAGTNLGNPAGGYVRSLVAQVAALWPKPASGPVTKSGYIFFTFHDPSSGAPQTQGLPAGMSLYRFRYDPKTGSPILAILSPQGFSTANGASGPIITTTPTSISTGSSNGPVWNQYAWMVLGASPSNPPGVLPPGVTTSGTWVWDPQQGGRFVWYPADGTVAQINGFWVYGNSQAFAAPNVWTAIPAPTSISPDGTAGTWTQVHGGYYVWTPGAAVTSYAWVWWLLGFVVVGGVVYELVD